MEMGTEFRANGYRISCKWVPNFMQMGTESHADGYRISCKWVPNLMQMGTEFLSRRYSGGSVVLISHLRLMSRLRMSGALTLPSHAPQCLHYEDRDTFTSTILHVQIFCCTMYKPYALEDNCEINICYDSYNSCILHEIGTVLIVNSIVLIVWGDEKCFVHRSEHTWKSRECLVIYQTACLWIKII